MSEQTAKPPALRRPLGPLAQAVRFFAATIAVGVVFATVFTLWTPSSLIPSGAAAQIAVAVATQSSFEATTAPAATPTAPSLPRIGVVSGHLGNDAGAVCADGLAEADVNYSVATRVQASLEQAGFRVDLLEEFDPRLEGYRAEALVSIHADSCTFVNDVATGFKVTGSLESRVPTESTYLANCLTDRYGKATQLGFHQGSITYDMTYYHAYREIAPETPAAIVEIGFLNLDRDLLTNHPDIVARGIVDGILCYVYGEPVTGVTQ